MRLYEIIGDVLANTKIMEMAFARKKIVDACVHFSSQIDLHIIKVVWFSNYIDVNHWCNEINGWLGEIDDMRYNNHKKLSGHEYYNILFKGYLEGGVEDMVRIVDKRIKTGLIDDKSRNDLTAHEAFEKVEKVLHAVCFDIANNKFVDIRDYI